MECEPAVELAYERFRSIRWNLVVTPLLGRPRRTGVTERRDVTCSLEVPGSVRS
jgi:hypothetical protein